MNKKALTQIEKVGIGSVAGVIGIVLMSFGSVLSNPMLLRTGIIITTIGGWLITW